MAETPSALGVPRSALVYRPGDLLAGRAAWNFAPMAGDEGQEVRPRSHQDANNGDETAFVRVFRLLPIFGVTQERQRMSLVMRRTVGR